MTLDPIIQLLSQLGPNALLAGAVFILWRENRELKAELKEQALAHGTEIKVLYQKVIDTVDNWRKALEADDDHSK